MAIFLSRIKRALNLGTKSITQNGTYNASSDGYDGYSSVEVNVSGVTPTPITPSNASPVALTSGNAVTPTGNGYAIESYSTVTPQEGIANQLVSGSFVKMNGSGYGIKDFTQITPSNAAPVSLSSNKFYKPSASGYAISSYSSKTPSDSSPASVSSGAIIKASASGYLVSSVNGNYSRKAIDETIATSWRITGLTPGRKYLVLVWGYKSSANMAYDTYDNAGVSNGTITKVSNLLTSGSIRAAGTFYYIKPTSSSVDLIHSTSFFAIVLDKGGA